MSHVTHDQALEIGKILIDLAGANSRILENYSEFINYLTQESDWLKEYRFMGLLGSGGKIYITDSSWKVDCYSEDSNSKREGIINQTNLKLNLLRGKYFKVNAPPRNSKGENLYLVGADSPVENGFR